MSDETKPYKFDGDPIAATMLPGFLENRGKDLQRIRELLAGEDWDEIRRLGHNMKGSGAAFGVPPVSEIGDRIEAAALAKASEPLLEALESLQRFLDAGVDLGDAV